MDLAKTFAVSVGLVYCILAARHFLAEERLTLVFRKVDSTKPLHFFTMVLHDAFAGLAFIWLGFFATNYIYGRIVTLWAAHLVVSMAVLLRFRGEDGTSYAWLGTPFFLVLGWYFYYLAIVEGVSIGTIFDIIEAFLDD